MSSKMLQNMTQPKPSEVSVPPWGYLLDLSCESFSSIRRANISCGFPWASRPSLGPCPYSSFLLLLELGSCQPSRASFLHISSQFMIGWVPLNVLTWIFKSSFIVEIFTDRNTIDASLVGGKYGTIHYALKHIIKPFIIHIKDFWDIHLVSFIDSYISEMLNLIHIDTTWSALQC